MSLADTRVGEILDLYAYNRWANARVFDATRPLTPAELTRDLGGSFPSVHVTLVHLVGAEWIWLQRWRGSSPRRPWDAAEFPSHAAIETRWREVELEQRAFLQRLTAARLDEPVRYRSIDGAPRSTPLHVVLRHLAHHGTYHRGQITTMLRQLGKQPIGTAYLLYYRSTVEAAQNRPGVADMLRRPVDR